MLAKRVLRCPYCGAGRERLESFEFGKTYCESCHRWFGKEASGIEGTRAET